MIRSFLILIAFVAASITLAATTGTTKAPDNTNNVWYYFASAGTSASVIGALLYLLIKRMIAQSDKKFDELEKENKSYRDSLNKIEKELASEIRSNIDGQTDKLMDSLTDIRENMQTLAMDVAILKKETSEMSQIRAKAETNAMDLKVFQAQLQNLSSAIDKLEATGCSVLHNKPNQ